jgi:hypothetical protein
MSNDNIVALTERRPAPNWAMEAIDEHGHSCSVPYSFCSYGIPLKPLRWYLPTPTGV